jgi:hypothetical protein
MEPHEFKKHSKIASILSAIGVFIILLSVVLFLYYNFKSQKITAKTEKSLNDSRDTVRLFKSIIKKDIVECTALTLKDRMDNGDAIYLFTLKIADSLLVPQLSRVDYFFDHPSYKPKLKTTSDSSNNFSISYRGWGCISKVPVYLHYKKTLTVDTIVFPMCDKTKVVLANQ